MAKRFTETKIWDDAWFQELPLTWKCFWWYLFCKCDEAGIWKVNHKLAEFQLGTKIKWAETEKIFNNGKMRIEIYGGFWIIKDFVGFQYGNKILNSSHPFHIKIREKLNTLSHRVSNIGYPNTLSDTLQEEVIVKEEVKVKEKERIPPILEDIIKYCQERNNGVDPYKFFNHYEAKGWVIGKTRMKNWKAAVHTWETKDKPSVRYD